MEPTALLTYALTLSAITLVPGPLVAVLAARAACCDRLGACALAIGICIGDILVILAICAGFGFWPQAHPEIFTFAKYAGVGLLGWIAIRMWRSSAHSADRPVPTVSFAALTLSGLALCLSSPQTVVMYLVLLPRVADLTAIRTQEVILLILATSVALLGVFLLVIVLAGAIQRLLRSPNGVALWGRSMSMIVAMSAAWVFFV